jgi:hypothetical protein
MDDAFHDALFNTSQSFPYLLANAMPRLLQSFVQSNTRSSMTTAHQPPNRPKQMRDSVMLVFGELDNILININDAQAWTARTDMVNVLQKNGLLVSDHANVSSRLTNHIAAAIDTLEHDSYSFEALQYLIILASTDIDILLPYIPRLLATWSSMVCLAKLSRKALADPFLGEAKR